MINLFANMESLDRQERCDASDIESVDHAQLKLAASSTAATGSPAVLLQKQDPFGDESNALIKYKTMAWWCVMKESLDKTARY